MRFADGCNCAIVSIVNGYTCGRGIFMYITVNNCCVSNAVQTRIIQYGNNNRVLAG